MAEEIIKVKYRPRGYQSSEDLDNWWVLDEKLLYQSLWKKIDSIDSLHMRRRINTRNAILYENFYHQNTMATGYPHNFGKVPNYNTRITYNVIRSVVDTIVARVTKNKPKVQFVTTGGSWSMIQKAKNLTRYVNASFKENNVYQAGTEAFIGSCVKGTGCLKFVKNFERQRIDIENVPSDEIIVDDADAIYGRPKCLYHVRYVNKWVLESIYPEYAEQINAVQAVQLAGTAGKTELIEVAEAWRLPLKGDGSDGRHSIAIKTATLFDEKYTDFDFPFSFTRWSKPMTGFYGTGVVDQLADIQQEIDRQLRFVSKALNLIAVPRIFLPSKSMIKDDEITNAIGHVIRFDPIPGVDSKPVFFTPQAVNAETYNFIKWLIESCYQLTGVSSLSAKSEKPAGLNAAVAIRTVQDIEKARFFNVADTYQEMYIDAGEKLVMVSRDLDKQLRKSGKGGLKVKSLTDNKVEVLRWSECDLDQDRYIMQAWPVSLLPDSPEGKLEMATELSEKGLISAYQATMLVDNPDLNAAVGLIVSGKKLIDKILNRIKEKNLYTPPEPYFDLVYGRDSAQQVYNESKLEDVPEDRLMKILQFFDDCKRLIEMGAEEPELPPEAPLVPEPALNPDAISEEMMTGPDGLPVEAMPAEIPLPAV